MPIAEGVVRRAHLGVVLRPWRFVAVPMGHGEAADEAECGRANHPRKRCLRLAEDKRGDFPRQPRRDTARVAVSISIVPVTKRFRVDHASHW
jgi:hypothetical protein